MKVDGAAREGEPDHDRLVRLVLLRLRVRPLNAALLDVRIHRGKVGALVSLVAAQDVRYKKSNFIDQPRLPCCPGYRCHALQNDATLYKYFLSETMHSPTTRRATAAADGLARLENDVPRRASRRALRADLRWAHL